MSRSERRRRDPVFKKNPAAMTEAMKNSPRYVSKLAQRESLPGGVKQGARLCARFLISPIGIPITLKWKRIYLKPHAANQRAGEAKGMRSHVTNRFPSKCTPHLEGATQ
jgi:hypothetical protein